MTERTIKLKEKNKVADAKARKLASVEAECKRKHVIISDKSREIERIQAQLV
jgi:hypothetical protein